MRFSTRHFLPMLFVAAALVGCGVGYEQATRVTLAGTAAVGFPIVGGIVNVKCAAGPAITGVPNTNALGAIAIDVTGQTLPCAVQVSGGTINGAPNLASYHSIATSVGTVNVTPLTDLLVANVTGSQPGSWFNGLSGVALSAVTPAQVSTALGHLRTALGLTAFSTLDPITLAFTPESGVPMDDILTALGQASAGGTYTNLLAAAGNSAGTSFAAPAGFGTALITAYGSTVSGGGSAAVPTVNGFSPNTGTTGTTVTITGTHLGSFVPAPFVKFGSTTANGPGTNGAYVFSSNMDSMSVVVPPSLAAGAYTVTIGGQTGTPITVGQFVVTAAGGGTPPLHGTLQATNAPIYVGNFTPAIPTATSKTASTVVTHAVTWTEAHTPNTVVEKLDVTFHAPGSSGFTAGTPISIQYLVSDAVSGAALPATLINCAQTPAACVGLTINTSTNIATFANLVVDGVTLTGTLSYLPPSTSGGGTGGGASTLTWASGTSGTSNELSGIAFGNNLYVAVGNGGTILTSADGASWTTRSSGSTKWLLDVVWNGSQFVVVGDFGVLLTSPDGINWTSRSSGTGTGISGIAWNGTKFVATVGGAVLTSTNGISWTTNSIANTSFYYGSGVITWDGTQFVAIGGQQGGVILTSTDGLTWVSHPASAGPLSSVIWTGSQFTAVGYPNTLVTSPDATTWTARTSGTPNGSFLNGIAWSGTSYVLVGDGGKIRQSSDAITWTANTSGTTNTLNDVVFGGGRFVTVGQGGTILKSQLLN